MKWTAHIAGGPKRVNHAAVLVGHKIFSLGGYWSSEDYDDWSQIPVHVLDTSTYRWKAVYYDTDGDVPFQKYGHTAVAYKDKIYVWGGRNNAAASDTLSCFDTKTLKWSSPKVTGEAPSAKDGHSACLIGNKMYIFGGFEYISEQYSQDLHCINLDTFKWRYIRTKGTPPCHRDFQTSVSYGDRMYVFGGRGDINSPYSTSEEVYCPQVYYVDVNTETWVNAHAGGTWPAGRRSHSAWIHNDYMYIFGGLNETIKTHFNDVYRYSLKGNYWEVVNVLGTGPSKRRRQACILYEDKVYLFGGTRLLFYFDKQHFHSNQEMDFPDDPNFGLDTHLTFFSKVDANKHALCLISEGRSNFNAKVLTVAQSGSFFEGPKACRFFYSSPCVHITYKPNVAEERLKDNSDLHILDLEPTLKTLCMLSVIEHKLDRSFLPRSILMDLRAMTLPNKITPVPGTKS